MALRKLLKLLVIAGVAPRQGKGFHLQPLDRDRWNILNLLDDTTCFFGRELGLRVESMDFRSVRKRLPLITGSYQRLNALVDVAIARVAYAPQPFDRDS